jgi:transcription elongation factor Elf1
MVKLSKVKEKKPRKATLNCPECGREIHVEGDHIEIVVEPNSYYHVWLDFENRFRCVCGQLLEVK